MGEQYCTSYAINYTLHYHVRVYHIFYSHVLQAVEERVKEQEAAAAERARLEEILTLCAEYDRQHQHPRQTHHVHHNHTTLTQNRSVTTLYGKVE